MTSWDNSDILGLLSKPSSASAIKCGRAVTIAPVGVDGLGAHLEHGVQYS